jgi:hypothetical protein
MMTTTKKAPEKVEKKKATEEKGEDVAKIAELPQMTEEEQREAQAAAYKDFMEEREAARKACGEEVSAILKKYGCEMTAQMVITEHKTVPQVFIIDERKRNER